MSTVESVANQPRRKPKPDVARFDNFKNFAYAGIFVVFCFTAAFNGFPEIWTWPTAHVSLALFVLRIILFGELLILTFRWIIATHNEFDMWVLWLNHPFQRRQVYGAIVALSVMLGVTLAFPHRIVLLTAILAVSALFTYWTQWLCNDHFARAVAKTERNNPDESVAKVVMIMRHYWLELPQLGRVATLMFVFAGAFSAALAGIVQIEPQRSRYELAAYGIVIGNILLGEIVIGRWRYVRDRDIERIADADEK